MELKSEREVINTREKLGRLEAIYEKARLDPTENDHVRELSMRSLKQMINQLKEEISRFEAHQAVPR